MKKFIILVIVIVLVALVYTGLSSWEEKVSSLVPVAIALVAQNQSGESGQALLTEVDGQVKVTLAMAGAPSGISQPAHIHHGSCAALGEPVYALSPTTADEVSETTLTATLQAIKAGLPLAINVHKSAAEPSVYVACGDILLEQ